jgi:hypothetical protein
MAVFGRALAPLTLAFAVAAAGCGGNASDVNVVEVRGDEYAYLMPERIDGGVVTMEFSNTGKELHEYALARLTSGKTLDDLRPLLENPEEAAKSGPPPWLDDIGGVPALSPGEEIAITRRLEPGAYVMLCFVPAPDGRPHIALGMARGFEVEGDAGAELPETDAVVTATDQGYELPELEAGRQTIELRNAAKRDREFYLLAPEPGVTLKEIEAWGESGFKGAPLATFLGALQSIPGGTSVYLTVELEPGKRYLLFDEELGKREFTVSE